MENHSPTYLGGKLRRTVLEDETAFLQYGQEDEHEFYNYELPPPKPSGWIDYPTLENPDGFYKFASIEINMS